MAKKMQRVIFTGLLSFFLVLVIAFTPIFVSNAATNLDGEPYQGLLQLIGPNPIVYCKFSSYKAEIGEGYGISSFEGSDPSIISFSQQKGYRYNGYAQLDVTYKLLSNVDSVLNLEQIGASLIYQTPIDGIHVSVRMLDRQYDSVKLAVNVFFNDYVATFDGNMHIPFTVRLETSATSNRTEPNILGRGLYFSHDVSADWHGFFRQFPFGGDAVSPGTGGTLIDQNDDIIANTDKGNQLQEQGNQLQQQQNQLVQDQTHQQHEDANNIMNGFDNTAGNAAGNQLDESLGSLESAEDNLFGNAGTMIDFDDYKSWLNLPGILSSAAFVSSILTLIHQYSGDFGVILIVGFILFIITRILGMQHFVGK